MAPRAGRLTLAGFLLLVTLLPLVYAPTFVALYRLPKQSLLALLAALLLWGLILSTQREGRVASLPLFFPVIASALATLLSLTRAINPYEGLIQSAQAIVGLGLFWVAATVLTEERAVLRLFHWASLAGAIVSLVGIAQVWGVTIPTLLPTGGTLGSTFGHANAAAQYLLLALPMAYALFFLAGGRAAWFWAVVAALTTAYLLATGSRASWGGALVAACVLSALLYWKGVSLRPLLRGKGPGLAVILACAVAMSSLPSLLLRDPGRNPRHSPIARLGTALEPDQDSSYQSRLAMTANSLVMFKDHPLTGVGKANFQFNYPLYARSVFKDPNVSINVYVRDAHNDYAQILAETGVLGFAGFAWILFGLARRFVRGLSPWRGEDSSVIGLAAAFGPLAILTVAFFDFPFANPVSMSFFWILAGVIWSRSEPQEADKRSPRAFPGAVTAALFLMACVATGGAAWGVIALRAEYHFSRGVRASRSEGRMAEARAELRRAVRLNLFHENYFFGLGHLAIKAGDYSEAIYATLRSLQLNPYRIGSLNNLGVAYVSVGKIPDAIQAFETAVRIWPDLLEARNNLGVIYASLGERDLAVAQFREVLRLNPTHERARAWLDLLLKERIP